MPTQAQFESWVKTTLGLLSGIAIGHGVGNDQLWTLVSGGVTLFIPIVWGYISNTKAAQVKQVAAMPEVKKVTLDPSVGDGLAAAAADPAQPKITK